MEISPPTAVFNGVPCLEWAGGGSGPQKRGLPAAAKGSTERIYVYRRAYEQAFGPIPDGYVVDHRCLNPRCYEPAHLEAVTSGENTRRHFRGQTHCAKGHEWTEENTIWRKDGRRRCYACYMNWEATHRGNQP